MTLVKDEQPLNAHEPILVVLYGILISVNNSQSSNAQSSIVLTLLGIVILVSGTQLNE